MEYSSSGMTIKASEQSCDKSDVNTKDRKNRQTEPLGELPEFQLLL